MPTRGPLGLPITLGIAMIVTLVALAVGWVLLSVFGANADAQMAGVYWALLSIGSTLFVLMLVGVIVYLALSIKAINLQRRQSNFIDSVTHELKSPIASLKLYLQTLTRRQVGPEEQASFYRFMLQDLDRLDQLINQMLDAGRLDRPEETGERTEIDFPALIEACAGEVLAQRRVGPQVLRMELEPCIARARRMDLELVVRNLLDNAVKYAGSEPQVEVRLRRLSHERAAFTVTDNGRGIPFQDRRKIFKRFVRLGNELERERPGTGLGLYIVRTAVRALKGRIQVRNRESGSGTVFEVVLPECAAPRRAPPPEPSAPPVPAAVESAES